MLLILKHTDCYRYADRNKTNLLPPKTVQKVMLQLI